MWRCENIQAGLSFFVCSTFGLVDGCASETATVPQPSRRANTAVVVRTDNTQLLAAWNAIALRTTAAGPFSPPRETRSMAIVSGAVFDAVNSITRRYEPWALRTHARHDASIDAAVNAAARRVIVALYPNGAATVDAAYDSLLALVPNGSAKDAGVGAGVAAADAALAARAHDHASDAVSYTPGHGVGVWIPTPPASLAALEPGWGKVIPFSLESASQFRPGPPPNVGSGSYERDLVEIREIGQATSEVRTPAQTEVARFWISTAPQLWNQVVRQLATAQGIDATAAARMYMLLNFAGADAMIAAWDAKYTYNQWRPVTAIRSPDVGNLTNHNDPTWLPLIVTPPFPDYPAGHTTYGGAAEVVLRALAGEAPGDLAISSATAGGATHHYQTFAEIAEEVVNARVWGGVHWRTSSVEGRKLGNRVGGVVLARAPRAKHH